MPPVSHPLKPAAAAQMLTLLDKISKVTDALALCDLEVRALTEDIRNAKSDHENAEMNSLYLCGYEIKKNYKKGNIINAKIWYHRHKSSN